MLPWKYHSKIEKRWLSCKPSGATLTAQNLCWLTAMGRDSLVGAKEALPRLSPHPLIVLYSYYILSLCIELQGKYGGSPLLLPPSAKPTMNLNSAASILVGIDLVALLRASWSETSACPTSSSTDEHRALQNITLMSHYMSGKSSPKERAHV